MALYNVTVTRERHYVEDCEVQVEAESAAEAEEKAFEEAENDGCWDWCDDLDDDCGEMQVVGINEVGDEYLKPRESGQTGACGCECEIGYLGAAKVVLPYNHAAVKSLSKKPKAPSAMPIDQ